MLRRVHLHHRLARRVLFRVHLLEPDALLGGERRDVAAHLECVLVLGDRPEARTVGLRGPVDRVFSSEAGERRMRYAVGVGVVRRDVGIVRAEIGEVVVDERGGL